MTNNASQDVDFDLTDVLAQKPPTFLIPKFNLLPLIALPANDELKLEVYYNEDNDFIENSESKSEDILKKAEPINWHRLNSSLNLSLEDQDELNNLLDAVNDNKLKFQRIDCIASKENAMDKEKEDYRHFEQLSKIAQNSLRSLVPDSAIEGFIPATNQNIKRRLSSNNLNDEEPESKKIKIKVQSRNEVPFQLRLSNMSFFTIDGNENLEKLFEEFDNIVTILNASNFGNTDVWFEYIDASKDGLTEYSAIAHGIYPSVVKTVEIFIEKLFIVFNGNKSSLTNDLWIKFYQVLENLSLNLNFNDDVVDNGRVLKLETIKVIISIYKLSLFKITYKKKENYFNKMAKPFKFDVMERCLSILAEYSQDIFDKETGTSDESISTFFNFFSSEEISLLYDCVEELNSFLAMKPILDSWSVNKIALSFQHIITLGNNVNKYIASSYSKILRVVNLIRRTATSVFTQIFQRYPDHRDLLLDLVITSFDKIPNTKQAKKLIEVKTFSLVRDSTQLKAYLDSDQANVFLEEEVVHISYFTYNLVSLLQSLNINFDINHENEQKAIASVLNSADMLQKDWLSWSVLITDSIFQRLTGSFFSCKSSLEVYYKDLMKLLKLPEWNIADYLMSSLVNKMIGVLTIDKKNTDESNALEQIEEQHEDEALNNITINMEALALQVLSAAGSVMLDISKSTTLKDNSYSLDYLSQNFSEVQALLDYLNSLRMFFDRSETTSLSNYFLYKTICLLVDIKHFIDGKKENDENSKYLDILESIDQQLYQIINQNYNIELSSSIIRKKESSVACVLHTLNFDQFLQASILMKFYEPYLKVILLSLRSKKARLRTGAMKNFFGLISKNKNIINLPSVRTTLDEMLEDSSPMVKDITLSILEKTTELTQYMNKINFNFNDGNLTVRRHVLALNQKIFQESSDLSLCIQSLHFIIRKLEDEETKIEQEVSNFLYETLFVKIYDLRDDLSAQEALTEKTVESLTGVISGSEKVHQLFQEFVNLVAVRQESKYDKQKKNDRIDLSKLYFALEAITKSLIIKIVDSQQDEKYEQFSKYVSFLGIIASFNSQNFIGRENLVILYPFLNMNANTKNEKIVRLSILKIFNYCLNKDRIGLRFKILGDMELFLLKNLTKFSITELDIVVSILFNIAKNRSDFGNLVVTGKSLLTSFEPYLNKLTASSRKKAPIQLRADIRLLKILTLLTSFAVYSIGKPQFFNLCPKNSPFNIYVAKILVIILKTQRHSNELLKTTLFQLGHLCNSHPAMYNSPVILNTILQLETDIKGVSDLVKIQFVRTMTLYLRTQELNPTKVTEEITLGLLTKITPLILPLIISNNNNNDADSLLILKNMIEFLKMLQYVKFLNPQLYLSYCIPLIGSFNSEVSTSTIRFFINLDYDLNSSISGTLLEKGLRLSLESFLQKTFESFTKTNLRMFKIVFCLLDKQIFNIGKVLKVFIKLFKEDVLLYSKKLRYDFKSSCFICMNILMVLDHMDRPLIEKFIRLAQLNLDKYEDCLKNNFENEEENSTYTYNGVLCCNVYKLFVESLEKKLENYNTVSFDIQDFKWDSISFNGPIEDRKFIITKYFG